MADDGPGPRACVAALLLNWRRADLTRQCLRDLLEVADVAMHVLVMDNASGDGSAAALAAAVADADRVAAARGATVAFAAFEDNLGFTGAMNRGLQWARERGAPFVLVLNNDVRLAPGFLRPLVDVLRNDARVAAVGPTILLPDGRVWAEGGRLGFRPNALQLVRQGLPPRPTTHGPEAVPFLPFACVLLRADAVAAAGGFDERYFMYWEDVDLCERLRARGGRVVWLPWVRVVHAAGQSSGGGRSPLRKFLMACNAVRYLRRCGTPRLWAGFVVFELLLWPLTLLAGPRAAWAKLRGTLAGLAGHRASARDVARWRPGPVPGAAAR